MRRRLVHLRPALLAFLILLVGFSSSAAVAAQDASGRPSRPKHGHTKEKPKPPEPITVTLTIMTHPSQCEIFVNGEDRGPTDDEGKIVINKLALGYYSIEARKPGFDTVTSRFNAGPQEPTLVLNLKVSIEEKVKQFQSLVASGKLDGPEEPNALTVVKALSNDFPDRPEVPKLRATLYASLVSIADAAAKATVLDPPAVSADQLNRAHNAATHAVGLVDNDRRARACDMYLEGVREMRAIESSGTVANPETKPGTDSTKPAEQETQPAGQTLPDALLKFENAAQIDQSLAPASYQLGKVLLLSNNPVAAEPAFMNALRIEPSWTLAHLGLAAAYYKDGKFPEAVQQYQLATQLDPKSSIAFAGLGAARAASGETEQGMKDLLAAIELDPNNAFPHYTLGLIYSKSKKKKDRNLAVDEFTRAIELNKAGGDFKNDDAERMISELKGHHKR